MEFLPGFLAILLCTALFLGEPATAGSLGLLWILARFLYAVGYASGNVNGRLPGFAISVLVYLMLLGNGAMFFINAWGLL